MNFEVFGDILSAHIQLNAVKVLWWRFLVKLDNYPKHTAKATQGFIEAKKANILEWTSQSPDLAVAAQWPPEVWTRV